MPRKFPVFLRDDPRHMWEILGFSSQEEYQEAICASLDDPNRIQQMWEEEHYWRRKRDRRYLNIINEDLF